MRIDKVEIKSEHISFYYYFKILHIVWLKQQIYFLTVLEIGIPRAQCQSGWFLVRDWSCSHSCFRDCHFMWRVFLLFLSFWDRVMLCCSGWPWAYCAAQAGLELSTILLPQTSECWITGVCHHPVFRQTDRHLRYFHFNEKSVLLY